MRTRARDNRFTPAHLSLELVVNGIRGTDRQLDLFRRALTDRDAVLAPHVRLDRAVDVERADAQRFERDDAAE